MPRRSTYVTIAVLALMTSPASAPAAPPVGGNGAITTGPSCQSSCITRALVEARTGGFVVTVDTDTPARIFVGVSRLIAPAGEWLDSGQSHPNMTHWGEWVGGLEPDTLYKLTVSATDSQGRTETRTTFARTLAVQQAVPAGPGGVQSNVGCEAQCIGSVKLVPDATGAGMTVDTTVPARLDVSVDDDAPGTVGDAPIFGTPEDRFTTDRLQTRTAGFVDRLKPGTTYHLIVRATDANGNTNVRQGIFRTKMRRAKLVLDGLRVYYDGDKGGNRGELGFRVAVNQDHQRALGIKERKTASGNWREFGDGGTLHLLPDSRGLNLAIQGIERDHASTCFDRRGSGLLAPDHGRIDKWCERWTWVTARKVVDLDAALPGASPVQGGAGTHEFEIATSFSAAIRFVVYGRVEVRYS